MVKERMTFGMICNRGSILLLEGNNKLVQIEKKNLRFFCP